MLCDKVEKGTQDRITEAGPRIQIPAVSSACFFSWWRPTCAAGRVSCFQNTGRVPASRSDEDETFESRRNKLDRGILPEAAPIPGTRLLGYPDSREIFPWNRADITSKPDCLLFRFPGHGRVSKTGEDRLSHERGDDPECDGRVWNFSRQFHRLQRHRQRRRRCGFRIPEVSPPPVIDTKLSREFQIGRWDPHEDLLGIHALSRSSFCDGMHETARNFLKCSDIVDRRTETFFFHRILSLVFVYLSLLENNTISQRNPSTTGLLSDWSLG